MADDLFLSARVDELNARVETLTRQVRTASPQQRGLGGAATATPSPATSKLSREAAAQKAYKADLEAQARGQ